MSSDKPEVLFIVKTDDPSKGKGVDLHTDLESALESVRFYLLSNTPVRVLVDRNEKHECDTNGVLCRACDLELLGKYEE